MTSAQPPVGNVEFSTLREVRWRVDGNQNWSPRVGGEYHCADLLDGRTALLRWISSETDPAGQLCSSLILGTLSDPSAPGLAACDAPAVRGGAVRPARASDLRAAFWRDARTNVQIGRLTGTGDRVREWLYLQHSKLDKHTGIFAQSGSGKSYALGRFIEEFAILETRLLAEEERVRSAAGEPRWKDAPTTFRFLLVDPNDDFENFSKLVKNVERKVLLPLQQNFLRNPAFVPYDSWQDWFERRRKDWDEHVVKKDDGRPLGGIRAKYSQP